MPYIKAKEYKELQKELKELRLIKRTAGWSCEVCEKTYYGIGELYLYRGDYYICGEDKTYTFQQSALYTIKGLRQHYLIDNIERKILQYLYNDGYKGNGLCLTADEQYEPAYYCYQKYQDDYY